MKKFIFGLFLFLAIFCSEAANVYINPTCPANGDGTTGDCAATGGAPGAKNTAVTTVSANTTYLYARGTTTTLASTAITVNQDVVGISSYGEGLKPIINPGSTTYPLVIGASNNCNIGTVDIRGGSSGAVNINGAGSGCTLDTTTIITDKIGVIAANASLSNLILTNMDMVCTGNASTCVQFGVNNGGLLLTDSTVLLTNTDKSNGGNIGVAFRGTASSMTNTQIIGGNIGFEARGTDGHYIYNSSASYSLVSGFRFRDSDNNILDKYESYYIGDNGDYPTGQGNGVDLIDIADTTGNNIISRGFIHDVYQAIIDQTNGGGGGGNKFIANLMTRYVVDGISYQSFGAEGLIAGNVAIHKPRSAGHAFAIQQGSTATTTRIVNNIAIVLSVGDNVQAISLPVSANTGATYLNNNDWYVAISGGHVGKLDQGTCSGVSTPVWCNYDTLATWQTALGADVDTTGDDANSYSVDPLLAGGLEPLRANDFKLTKKSPMKRKGFCYGTGYCVDKDYWETIGRIPPNIGADQTK